MPQMMPMTWLIMMMFFIFCLLMTISFLYFLMIPQISTKMSKTMYNMYKWNWMW